MVNRDMIMKGKIGVLLPIAALVAASLAPAATAQEVDNLLGAVTQSVLSNPRVNASWYNFEATREAQRSAQGGYFPSVDVNGEVGEENRDTPLIETGNYSRDAVRFSITQMLFDGFQTREEVSRLGYAKLSRYYDLKRASEEVALEATEAYVDTMRFQRLVGLAEDNYIVHRQIFDKISESRAFEKPPCIIKPFGYLRLNRINNFVFHPIVRPIIITVTNFWFCILLTG